MTDDELTQEIKARFSGELPDEAMPAWMLPGDNRDTCIHKDRGPDGWLCNEWVEYLKAGQKGNQYSGWYHEVNPLDRDHHAVPKRWAA